MDPLLPTLKKRKRYIAIGILSDEIITKKILNELIFNTSKIIYGEIETLKYGIYILKYNNNIGIIRCWHKYINQVLSILSIIRFDYKKNINIRIFGYSGTINCVQKKYINPNISFNKKIYKKKREYNATNATTDV